MKARLFQIALTALLLLLAGCGGSDSSGEATGPVRFLIFGDPEEINAYRELVGAYEEAEPDADVQLVEAGDRSDLIARLSTSIAGGTPPDLFLMNYRYYGQFASKGAIEPIAARLEDSDAFSAADFYPQAMEAFSWKGEQLCLPQNISSLVVYYNKTLFERQQVAEPKDGWKWRDLVATAQQLTLDANGNRIQAGDPDSGGAKAAIYGLGIEPSLIRLAPLVWSIGGDIVDDPAKPARLTLDTPAAQIALVEFFALRTGYGVIPSDIEVEAEDDEARFSNGRLAMLVDSRRATPAFRAITDFEWDVAPFPGLRDASNILHSDAFCMTEGSKRKDAAWKFMEFSLGREGQRILAATGRTVPSLREVATSEAFLDPGSPPSRAKVWLDAIPSIRSVPTISTWPEIEDAAGGLIENGVYLAQPPAEVAGELDRATRPIFARGESG